MGIFDRRRRRAVDPAQAIQEFWVWWAGVRDDFDPSGGRPDLVREVDKRVSAIHRDLEWETAAGRNSRHCLVVSCAGDARLRPLTESWRTAGPPDDDLWEYAPARRRDPGFAAQTLQLAGVRIELASTFGTWDRDTDRWRIDVAVGHPSGGDLDESGRGQFAFLALDWLLGEDDVERWVGTVEVLTGRPSGARPLTELLDEVTAIAALSAKAEGSWSLLEGTSGRFPTLASVRTPLHRLDHLAQVDHVAVTLDYDQQGPDMLPTPGAVARLSAFEDALMAAAPAALLVAHETGGGSRTLHFYVPSAAQAIVLMEPELRAWPHGAVEVTSGPDPDWSSIRHLRP